MRAIFYFNRSVFGYRKVPKAKTLVTFRFSTATFGWSLPTPKCESTRTVLFLSLGILLKKFEVISLSKKIKMKRTTLVKLRTEYVLTRT